jgi:spoIIIJ-associated protein
MGSINMKGKTTDEAIELALQVLGKTRDEVDVRVISEGEGGVLGVFGAKEAEVEVSPKASMGEAARALVQEILDKMQFLTLVSIKEEAEDTINLEIKGEDMGRIIGRAGATIDSLQYLSSIILSKKSARRIRVLVDAEGYRERRQKVVTDDAQIVAKDVEATGKERALPPMSAADRRLIHIYIQEKFPGLTSYSKGEGANRQVVIAPKTTGS